MQVVFSVFHTLGGALWTLMGLPTFWCVVLVFLFESLISICDTILRFLGCVLQQIVFGELRIHDENASKDRLWNFIFYKFIFVFAVLNISKPEAIFGWAVWFAILGFVHLLTQLCQDRFDYISVSSHLQKSTHFRIVTLIGGLACVCGSLHMTAFSSSRGQGLHYFLLVDAEVAIVTVKICYITIRYGLYVLENSGHRSLENRADVSYQTDLAFNFLRLTLELFHDLHLLIWSNVYVSLASIVISFRIHSTITDLRRRLAKHKRTQKISTMLMGKYPTAANDQLLDPCAICWEKMISARTLPCQHVFHEYCLRSWLEQDTTCPKCRLHLDIENHKPKQTDIMTREMQQTATIFQTAQASSSQHVFQFNGSRLISWLPTVSLEVSHSAISENPTNGAQSLTS